MRACVCVVPALTAFVNIIYILSVLLRAVCSVITSSDAGPALMLLVMLVLHPPNAAHNLCLQASYERHPVPLAAAVCVYLQPVTPKPQLQQCTQTSTRTLRQTTAT